MKKSIIFSGLSIAILFGASVVTSCGKADSTGDNDDSTANDGISTNEMSDAKCNGLVGKVKTVTTTQPSDYGEEVVVMNYNTDGQLTSIDNYGYTITYTYTTPSEYTCDGNTYTITYDKNTRSDNAKSDEGMRKTWEFNDNGQLIEETQVQYDALTTKYTYANTSDNYPSKAEFEYSDTDIQRTTINYTYVTFDDQGNWTKRIAKRTVSEEYDDGSKSEREMPTITETRTITYWD